MAIVHKVMPDGGFVCGDTQTGRTAYAYPTSPHATKARKSAATVAKAMMRNVGPTCDLVKEYDARNWQKLERQASHACPRCGMIVPDRYGTIPCWHRECPETLSTTSAS